MAGCYGGDPDKVLRAPVDRVLAMKEYQEFYADYDSEIARLNMPEVKKCLS
jgi:hypothetical protein